MYKANIIGRGMIAASFQDVHFNKPVMIFASGVSNSKETRVEEFLREKLLVEQALRSSHVHELVYFSTTALNLGLNSRYTEHKKEVEELISANAPRYFIFRLPQVVGLAQNRTLISYLTRIISRHEILTLQRRAIRNLLDVADLARITQMLVNAGVGIRACNNLASGTNVSVYDIAAEIRRIAHSSSEFELIDAGDDQSISIDFLREHLSPDDEVLASSYWTSVLNRYVPQLISSF